MSSSSADDAVNVKRCNEAIVKAVAAKCSGAAMSVAVALGVDFNGASTRIPSDDYLYKVFAAGEAALAAVRRLLPRVYNV